MIDKYIIQVSGKKFNKNPQRLLLHVCEGSADTKAAVVWSRNADRGSSHEECCDMPWAVGGDKAPRV